MELTLHPNSYQYEVLSDEVTLNFHSVKLLDYKLRWAELEKSDNIFAIINNGSSQNSSHNS